MAAVPAGDGADFAVREQSGDGSVGEDVRENRDVLVAGAVERLASFPSGEENGRERFAGRGPDALALLAKGGSGGGGVAQLKLHRLTDPGASGKVKSSPVEVSADDTPHQEIADVELLDFLLDRQPGENAASGAVALGFGDGLEGFLEHGESLALAH